MSMGEVDVEVRVVKGVRAVLVEEMISMQALSERWHCSKRSIERVVKRYRESGGKRGLLSVGVGRRTRIPARAANRYAKGDDFLRT